MGQPKKEPKASSQPHDHGHGRDTHKSGPQGRHDSPADQDGRDGQDGQDGSEQHSNSNNRLLTTLERLLSIESTNVKSTLDQASDLIADAVHADKTDTFLYEPSTETLVAMGTSHTPMGERQRQVGLDRLPLANGGPEVGVLHTGECYITGHAEQDTTIPLGMIRTLGIRSTMIAPVEVSGERRGVLQSCSAQHDAFSKDDLDFLQAVAHWVGVLTHRAELVERIAQDAAAQARQVVAEELVTVLAHDLGNYMTPIKGRLAIVQRRATREGRDRDIQDLNAAQSALNRLQSLVNDLLDIGRLDQGLFSINRQPVDLVALIQETVGAMQTGKPDILLRVPDELAVEVDPMRVRQALENLISNASKHSPKGAPIDVEVTSEKREDDGKMKGVDEDGGGGGGGTREWAIIRVQDQGPGIPAELYPRLFTRFGAGPNSTGMGLGLYLARSIVEAHGGTLTANSNPGEGTTFYMAFPAFPSS